MMALSLMSSDQIRAHQSPTVRKFLEGNILRLYENCQVSNKPWENRDFSGERRQGRSGPGRSQQLSLPGSWLSCCRQTHFLAENCQTEVGRTCGPTLLCSHHKLGRNGRFVLQTGRSLGLNTSDVIKKLSSFVYIFSGALLLLLLGVQDELLQRRGELPDVPPHHRPVSAGREELRQRLALDPHGLVDRLYVGHRQTDLTLGLPALPVIPPADLAVITAARQQVAVLGVKLAGDQVVGRVEIQVGLGGIL